MKNTAKFLFTILLANLTACSFFGEKNKVSDYIEKPDYSLKSVEYVPVYPDFGSGITPSSIYIGYDELLYAVDSAKAIISYDAAGREVGRMNLEGVEFVIQNRSLDLYALGRIDTTFNNVTFNVPVIYKIGQKESSESGTILALGNAKVLKRMVYPFCINETAKLNNKTSLEATKLSSIGFMDDNSYYVTSNGPQESAGELFITRRSSVLSFTADDVFQGGITEGDAQRSLAPFGLTTLVQPPQRARMETKKDFIYTSITPDLAISVRYMQVLITPEGQFTNFKPLAQPAKSTADGYLYETFRFTKPSAVIYAGTSQKYIFVADEARDSVYAFQENGYEGTNPPPQYTNRKLINVSFGGYGSGPKQFNRPVALAWSNRMLYVADAGNHRISRFKLTSDYE